MNPCGRWRAAIGTARVSTPEVDVRDISLRIWAMRYISSAEPAELRFPG